MLTATTANQLAEFVPELRPGQGVIYHVGHLCDGDPQVQQVAMMARQLSNMLIPDAHGAIYMGQGVVTLVQRRVEKGFEYIAIRLRTGDARKSSRRTIH